MKKRLLCIFLLSVLVCTLFVFSSCGKERDYTEEPLTKEEIRSYVEKKYFDKDGNFINWYFENASNGYALKEPFKEADITDFDVQFIKDANGKERFFLVEFEPNFHIYGYRDQALEDPNRWQLSFWLRPFPSPFKILNVKEDERYMETPFFATKRDGYLVAIDDEALYGRYLTETRTGKWNGGTSETPTLVTYDYEANEWIQGTRNYRLHPLTETEIENWIQTTFYSATGEIKANLWQEAEARDPLKERYVEHYDGKEVTGYKLSYLKDIDGKEEIYLIEFEPYGYKVGSIYFAPNADGFKPYPSPFALLDISEENRYYSYGRFVTIRDGKYTDITEEATMGRVYAPNQYYRPKRITYDEETKSWVTEFIEEE